MGYPIDGYDVELVIKKEMQITQTNSNLTHSATVVLDNTGNLESFPIMTITVNNTISTLTVSNVTTGITMSLTNESNLVSGAVLNLYHDSIYNSNSTELSATFDGVFSLAENLSNTLKFNLVPSTTASIKVDTQWLQPSPVEIITSYAEGFSINEVRTQRKSGVNLLNKYTNKYINQDISYDFSIDTLWYNDWFHDESEDETYRLTWKTDENNSTIEHMVYHLSGCSFNALSWSKVDNELVKQNIRGNACRKFQG